MTWRLHIKHQPPAYCLPTSNLMYQISSIYSLIQNLILIWFFFDSLSPPHTFIICVNMWLWFFFFFFFAVDGYELNICIIDLWVYNCEFVTVFVSLY